MTLVVESGGTTSYSAVSVIFRPQAEPDPTVADALGHAPTRSADMVMYVPQNT